MLPQSGTDQESSEYETIELTALGSDSDVWARLPCFMRCWLTIYWWACLVKGARPDLLLATLCFLY